jgi:hypothetical protein
MKSCHLVAARNAGGIADFIQPTLVQLQPNLEDFMDTLEPLQGKDNCCYRLFVCSEVTCGHIAQGCFSAPSTG